MFNPKSDRISTLIATIMPRPIHIALTFDDNFWAPAFAVMRSVCLTTRRRDITFHLLHDGLKAERHRDFTALAEEFGVRIAHIDLAGNAEFDTISRQLPVDGRLHKVMYARLFLHRLLPQDIERIVYLDCDTLIVAPIEDLAEHDMAEYPIAAVSDALKLYNMMGRDMREKAGIFDPAQDYFNSGVLLIDRAKFAEVDPPARLADLKVRGLLDRLYFDQDILNLVFNDNWAKLDWRFNITDPHVAHQAMAPKIVHYTGKVRPWHLYSHVAFRRTYRHVMTNDLFYRYLRHRWARYWLKKIGR